MAIVLLRVALAAMGAVISITGATLAVFAIAVWLWWTADPSDDQRNPVLAKAKMSATRALLPSSQIQVCRVVGPQGFEPWTDGLKVRCSAN